jgi:hypothetical protein
MWLLSIIPDKETALITWTVILIAVAVLLALASLGGGIYCLIRYAKTRKKAFLIVGLILSFILPGIFLCIALGIFIPSTMIVYGPPPEINP